MSATAWQASGRYYETCSCDMLCPCIVGQMAVKPTRGSCDFAMAFQIERGRYGATPLDGLGFVVLGRTPAEMANGNWSVGLIVDEGASTEQREAITAIASGAAGGPMAAVSPLVGEFLGVESARVRFDHEGGTWSVSAAGFVDMAAEAVMGLDPDAVEPLHLDNTGHPAASRFALAHPSKSHVSALGLEWHDTSGKNNGQFAPFSWASA